MNTAVVMLAAGQSQRFGGSKQLAQFRGQPMICHGLANLPPGLQHYYVVLGANWQPIEEVVKGYDEFRHIRICVAEDWEKGLAHSLRFALSQLSPEVERVMICLADQVALGPEDYMRLLCCADEHPGAMTAAYYQHSLGVPAIFCRTQFSQLMQLQGDKGARALLQGSAELVQPVAMPAAAIDIDTQQDLIIHQDKGERHD
ncbi:nucleotidyltransferase family protein [Lacimicrobium sp. SS2-24]|uniref:nucleotidyltransferase family protein n=1 Tax=Lacimicrobium sp. SS2-24 TaxID=2005569 RepID=UPI000B4BD338|nr:nucleotidyltransferase family protein [Lacimicrobium sp. SS2-24]